MRLLPLQGKSRRALARLIMPVLLTLLSGGAPAWSAGSNDCILDNCADRKPPVDSKSATEPKPQSPAEPAAAPAARIDDRDERVSSELHHGPSRPGDFDFYVLSLSWSPGFCQLSEKSYSQCDGGSHLGFVVHGLWPQYEHGFPEDCSTSAQTPSRIAVESAHGLYPDDGLARYEWRRHGTCSGKSPTDYFADVRRAREAVTIPTPFQSAKESQNWTPVDIERAFIAANASLKPGMIAVGCRRGTLQDVKICFSKDLQEFRACPEVVTRDCRSHDVAVPPLR